MPGRSRRVCDDPAWAKGLWVGSGRGARHAAGTLPRKLSQKKPHGRDVPTAHALDYWTPSLDLDLPLHSRPKKQSLDESTPLRAWRGGVGWPVFPRGAIGDPEGWEAGPLQDISPQGHGRGRREKVSGSYDRLHGRRPGPYLRQRDWSVTCSRYFESRSRATRGTALVLSWRALCNGNSPRRRGWRRLETALAKLSGKLMHCRWIDPLIGRSKFCGLASCRGAIVVLGTR